MTTKKPTLMTWSHLSLQEQLQLREDYGRYLDQLPPTCSLETKIERFRQWLLQRGIRYDN